MAQGRGRWAVSQKPKLIRPLRVAFLSNIIFQDHHPTIMCVPPILNTGSTTYQPVPQMKPSFGYVYQQNSTEILACSEPLPVYQALSTHHDQHVKKAIINLPVWLKGKLKRNGEFQNKDIDTALQALLTGVRLRPRHRLALISPACTCIPCDGLANLTGMLAK